MFLLWIRPILRVCKNVLKFRPYLIAICWFYFQVLFWRIIFRAMIHGGKQQGCIERTKATKRVKHTWGNMVTWSLFAMAARKRTLLNYSNVRWSWRRWHAVGTRPKHNNPNMKQHWKQIKHKYNKIYEYILFREKIYDFTLNQHGGVPFHRVAVSK